VNASLSPSGEMTEDSITAPDGGSMESRCTPPGSRVCRR
jgi:hypothetical protein